jgi:putative addiction module killer protein
MVSVQRSATFTKWLDGLKDRRGRAKILFRLERLGQGSFGVTRGVGEGVFELKIDTGPGYRVYCLRDGEQLVVLLCGGDKSTQARDIDTAHAIARAWRDRNGKGT